MDTSNSRNFQDFKVIELESSRHPEDQELAAKARVVVAEVVEELKPILRYISERIPLADFAEKDCEKFNPIINVYSDLRAIRLMRIEGIYPREMMFLSEKGDFFTGIGCKFSLDKHYHLKRRAAEGPWKLVPFGELVAYLKKALQQAEEKRQLHLHSIQERREKLDEILQILKK